MFSILLYYQLIFQNFNKNVIGSLCKSYACHFHPAFSAPFQCLGSALIPCSFSTHCQIQTTYATHNAGTVICRVLTALTAHLKSFVFTWAPTPSVLLNKYSSWQLYPVFWNSLPLLCVAVSVHTKEHCIDLYCNLYWLIQSCMLQVNQYLPSLLNSAC